jgi:hypothetical protein
MRQRRPTRIASSLAPVTLFSGALGATQIAGHAGLALAGMALRHAMQCAWPHTAASG